MNKIYNVGLLGAGRIGKIHAHNVATNKNVRLHSVADAVPEAANQLAALHNSKASSIDAIFLDQEIDFLIIASPTNTHADFLERACQQNKPSLCEKPIDTDITRAAECLNKLEQANAHCGMGFNRRHDPLFRQLKEDLRAGKIGSLEMLIITSRDPSPPPIDYLPSSGGLFRDMSIHDLDIARWLLDETITEVYASGSNLVDKAIGQAGDIDTAMINLRTQSGKLCCINNSRRAVYGYDQRIEAFGSEGMLQADNQRHNQLLSSNAAGTQQSPLLDFFLERYEQAYKDELQDFIDSLSEQRQPLANHVDGLKALELAEAAQSSFDSGQPVQINC